MKAARRSMMNLRPLIVFCLSVLFASAAGLGAMSDNLLVGSISTFAFLSAVGGLLALNLLTIFRPPGSDDEDGSE